MKDGVDEGGVRRADTLLHPNITAQLNSCAVLPSECL